MNGQYPFPCLYCKAVNPPNARFCLQCGRAFAAPQVSFWKRWRSYIALSLLALVIFIMVIQSEIEKRSPDRSPATTAETIDNAQALQSFRQKIQSLPAANKVILGIEGTPVNGVVRIQVSNLWFNYKPGEKRQLTQLIANLWSQELKGGSAIVHIHDVSGREIAGTRAFGGVWVEDE
jgi:hypothetical protein